MAPEVRTAQEVAPGGYVDVRDGLPVQREASRGASPRCGDSYLRERRDRFLQHVARPPSSTPARTAPPLHVPSAARTMPRRFCCLAPQTGSQRPEKA